MRLTWRVPLQVIPAQITCDQCGGTFETPDDVLAHQLATHATTFCVLCLKSFSKKNKWRRHVNCVHGYGKVRHEGYVS